MRLKRKEEGNLLRVSYSNQLDDLPSPLVGSRVNTPKSSPLACRSPSVEVILVLTGGMPVLLRSSNVT